MALALNRYLCTAVLPLITKCAPLFAGTEHRAIMIDSMLHTIYRLSRGRSLTKAQRDVIEACLMALCSYLRPSMLQHLLRRLVFDVPILNEYARMPLKISDHWVLISVEIDIWVLKLEPTNPWMPADTFQGICNVGTALFGNHPGAMVKNVGNTTVFHPDGRIMKYDTDLFKAVMQCLCAIAGALPPDYVDASYSSKVEKKASVDAEGNFDPKPVDTMKSHFLFVMFIFPQKEIWLCRLDPFAAS
eukprot:g41233.t1